MGISIQTAQFASISNASRSSYAFVCDVIDRRRSWSNVTLGQTCVVENTVYTGFADETNQYAFIISRDKSVYLICQRMSSADRPLP
jgi:hypothetical protein